jgi:PKD repeat protein
MDSDAAGADTDIISRITSGIGFANYTAHCNEIGWAEPSVVNADIANFNNLNKYPFMIGNCCLSFKFDYSDAFGENLLQTANEGAVGYIGTSNNSLWDEDFWWGVGLSSVDHSNTANVGNFSPTNSEDGAYDALFHETGQPYSEWFYTASQIVYSGNMQVQASGSSNKKYYWEIYHCSGDPSLMPYMSEPDALSLSFPNPMQGATTLTVTTEPYTYVAVSKSNVLLDAKWSGSGTSVTLTVPAFTGETYCVVGTKQDRSPYINESVVPVAANPPVANFTGTPTTILEGQSVTFTDASQYPASWSWNFGDSQTSTVQNPVHVYTTAGTYTVSLAITNGLGNDTETKTNYITVNPNTNPPTADFVANVTTVAIGETVNFTDLSINNPSSWSWTFDGGTPASSTSQNPAVVYNTPGTYEVSLTATNAFGSDVETKLAYITVTLPDYCAAASSNAGFERITNFTCNTINNTSTNTTYSDFTSISTDLTIGNTYAFTVTLAGSYSTDQVLIWCDWNRDGDFVDAGENVFTSATGAGPFSGNITVPSGATAGPVRVRIRLHDTSTSYSPNATPCGNSGYGEVEDYTFNLTSPAVPPTASFTAAGPEFCAGEVTFTDASIIADSWAWDFGDGNTSTEQNPIHNYSVSGTYTVALTVTNAYGSDTDTQTDLITIDIPVAPTTTGASACGPASLTLNAAGSGTLAWYDAATNGNQIATGTSYTNTFNNTTTVYVQSQIATPLTANVGPVDYSFGAGANLNSNTDHGMIFDVTQPVRIVSVVVWSSNTGNKTITLKNSGGTTLASQTVNITTANVATTVTLNFDVPVGTGYQLLGGTLNRLYRNSAGASYPYSIDGVVSIVNNTAADLNYYYFFYDWTVEYDIICSSARTPVTAIINTLPIVDLGDDQTSCGGTVTLDAGAGHTSYVWNGTPGTQTYNAATTGTYTVVVSNAQGCTASDAANVTINALPTAVSVAGGGTQCGGSMTLTATNGGSGTIYWQGTTSGGTSTTTASTSQSVSASGTYYFRAQSAEGCWGPEGSATVTINPLPGDVTVSGGGTYCGGSATLTATGGTGGTIYWQNTTSNGTSVATPSSSQTVSSTGMYYFRARTTEGCWGNQDSEFVVINSIPAAVTVAGGGTQCGGSMTLTATNGGDGTIYFQGTNPLGESLVDETNTYAVSASGTYYFRALSSEGCWGPAGSATVTINPLPGDVTVSGGGTYCGGSATLTATGGAGGTIYWQNTTSNGTSTAVPSTSQTVSTTATYYFRAQSAEGCWGNQGSTIVYMYTGVDISMSSTDESAPGANDGTVTVTVNSGTPDYQYFWNVAGTTATLTGLTGATYCVTVADINGCEDYGCITVNTLGAPPVADFETDVLVGCDNLTVNFTDLSTNNPTSWAWDFGDGNTSNLQNPTHVYNVPGVYTVALTATNINGSDTETIVDMITVGETPTLVMSMTQESQTPGMDGTASVSVTGGLAPYSYEWTGGYTTDEISGLEADTYCVTVTESNGCMAMACIDVTQEEPLTPPVADFEADETMGCETLTVQFTDLSTNNPTTWAWDFGDGATSVEQNPEHTYTTIGLFTVTLTVTNDDGSDVEEMADMIFVGAAPVVSVDVVHASGELVADGSAEVVIVGGTAPYDILWSNDETTTEVTDLLPGNYSVMVVDASGCIVTEPFTVSWTNSVDNSTIEMSIFPNPASDYVTVEMEGAIAQKISVTNALGQVVIEFNPTATTSIINFAGVEPGVYFVNITADGKEFNEKIVVKK